VKLLLVIAYDGRPFSGWQSQAKGGSVQDVLEAAFAKIAGERIIVRGAGRTDAGVHALGQCAHVDVPDRGWDAAQWQAALNGNLPAEVRVMHVTPAADGFHARFSARGKIYRYLVRNQPVLPPLEIGRVWHEPRPLDETAVRAAAEIFVGRHDFAAFAANRGDAPPHTVRTVHQITVTRTDSLYELTFTGEGFLYKMVRMLTAAIVRAGQGRTTLDDLRRRLATGQPKWNHVAPAEGLTLVAVRYEAIAPDNPQP
jgi:tRNA pseudouridine38-40 synthase